MNKGPNVSGGIAVAIIALLIGGAAGYYARFFQEPSYPRGASSGTGGMMGGSGSGMSGMMGGSGGGMSGMMGGGGQGQPQNGMILARTVRNLSLIQHVQNQGLTPEQARTLLPILKEIKAADKIPDADAQAKVDAINKVLTDAQKAALQDMTPQFGGGRRGGGPPSSGGMPPGSAGRGPMSGGMSGGMGGGRPDPERPFASERNSQALDGLMSALEKPGQP
jgi:hypothetical protein